MILSALHTQANTATFLVLTFGIYIHICVYIYIYNGGQKESITEAKDGDAINIVTNLIMTSNYTENKS